ncbi:MAG: hypothetical protein ABIA63_09065 [bacterium]
MKGMVFLAALILLTTTFVPAQDTTQLETGTNAADNQMATPPDAPAESDADLSQEEVQTPDQAEQPAQESPENKAQAETPQTEEPAQEAIGGEAQAETPAEPEQPAAEPEKIDKSDDKEEEKQTGAKNKVSYNLSVSNVTVEGHQWTRLNIRPDIPIGPFGVALDLELFIDDKGNVSNKGYQFDNAEQAIESILRRIYYVRFHKPGDKIYARVGALDDVSLGYGLLVNGYANTLDYPEIKKLGINFELNDITKIGFGIQTFINNVEDFKNSGAVIGTRLSVKPLKLLGMPVLKNLDIGFTYVTDLNQYAGLRDYDGDTYPNEFDAFPDEKEAFRDDNGNKLSDDKEVGSMYDFNGDGKLDSSYVVNNAMGFIDTGAARTAGKLEDERKLLKDHFSLKDTTDAFSMICLDAGLPLINTKLLGLDVYGQYALNIDDDDVSGKAEGWGIAFPGFGFRLWRLKASLEFRHFENRFSSEYFNNLYEHNRVSVLSTFNSATQLDSVYPVVKDALIDSISLNGIFGKMGLDLIGIIQLSGYYQYMFGDTLANQQAAFRVGPGDKIMDIVNKIPLGPMKLRTVGGFLQKQFIGAFDLNGPKLAITQDSTLYNKPDLDGFFDPTPFLFYGFEAEVTVSKGVGARIRKEWTHMVDPTNGKIVAEPRMSIESFMSF